MSMNEQIKSAVHSIPQAECQRVFENNQRIEFTELFSPESTEYTLEHVWGTTYSVSLSAMLMALFAMEGLGKVPDLSEGKTVNKAQQLEILRRNLPKLTILFQQGMIHQDAKLPPEVLSMLMTALSPQVRKEGSFHPKVWLWAFQHKSTKRYKFRLLVTSRNLTQDTDFDAAVVFDSVENKPQDHRILFDLFDSSLSPEWRNRLSNVTFSGNMYESIKDKNCIHTVISPFLDAEKIKKDLPGLKYLFSTKEALDSLDLNFSDKNIQCFILRDLSDSTQETAKAEIPHVNLHAKLYFSDSYLLLGSRNCTSRGWYKNVEFMVRLGFGQKSETLLNSLVYDPDSEVPQRKSNRNRTQALFEPYIPQHKDLEKNDTDEKKSELIEFLRTVDCKAGYDAEKKELELLQLPHTNLPLTVTPFFLNDDPLKDQPWQNGPTLRWSILPNQRSPFFSVHRTDLPNFTAILIAKPKDEIRFVTLNDYIEIVKSTFTNEEYFEYLCSIGEVPLDDIEIISEHEHENPNSENSWNNRNHRFLERLVQNIVAHPDLVELYWKELHERAKTPDVSHDFSELAEFFSHLRKGNHI